MILEKDFKVAKRVRRIKGDKAKKDLPKFKSIHAKLMYLEFERRKGEKDFSMTLEELKKLLMAPELAHIYSHLRLRVLDAIEKEFQEIDSPIKFSYEVIKEQKAVKFIIR